MWKTFESECVKLGPVETYKTIVFPFSTKTSLGKGCFQYEIFSLCDIGNTESIHVLESSLYKDPQNLGNVDLLSLPLETLWAWQWVPCRGAGCLTGLPVYSELLSLRGD